LLVEALFLDPDHPRANLKPELKAWNQTYHAEALAQLAVWPAGKAALRQDPSVREGLEVVAKAGLTEEAQQHAQSALLALSDTKLIKTEGQKHVMLSCEH
jgi:predicted oxidoreductase